MSKKLFSLSKKSFVMQKEEKCLFLVDDKDRENEGDLIIPGSKCSSKKN